MATHGTVGVFDPSVEDWVSYSERLEQYFTANGIGTEDADLPKRRAILLSCCGPSTYQLIRNLVAPGKPTEKTFVELVELVRNHHQPTPSFIVQRYNFHMRLQRPGESIGEFVAQLRKLSEHCRFGGTLDDMLRDRIVCGCRDKKLQCKLLAEAELTLAKAFASAKAMETAEREAKELHADLPSTAQGLVHSLRDRPGRKKPEPPRKSSSQCSRCGAHHSPDTCRFKTVDCNHCGKRGHIARVCRSKARSAPKKQFTPLNPRTHQIELQPDSHEYAMFYSSTVQDDRSPIQVTLSVSGADVTMEVDTGAALSIISEETYNRQWAKDNAPPLQQCTARLKTYTGEALSVKGALDVLVVHRGTSKQLSLVVVAGTGPSLMGRDWLRHITLDWTQLNLVRSSVPDPCQAILSQHSKVFHDELGHLQETVAHLHVDASARPRFHKARPVPYALRSKVEAELDRLRTQGVIEPVSFSDWAAPIVPVVKRDGSIRICGDYKLTANQAAKTDAYPLPRIEDIFASLSKGKLFSKLDLASAYQQVPLADDSRRFTTINTSKGLFQYTRLPFGVASAPAIFQRIMETVLQGIPNVCVYLDDVLVTGPTDEEHLRTLDQVLSRLEEAGARLKREKCAFMLPSVEYLGHRITAAGLQPTDEKVRALRKAPVPGNVSQLKSFLGLLNYYHKFLPNLSHNLAPLHRLLQKHTSWEWGPPQQEAFDAAKDALTSDQVLVHYDPDKELILACDASPYGVGAVLSHRMEDGSDKPIAFASRSLAPAEKRYSQLDKEGLAIIFGVKRFHQYLVGRHFVILSDHKPLQHLFRETSGVPVLASARIQRWALILGAYDYSIEYKPGPDHANADVLSRLPLPESPREVPVPGETILSMEMLLSTLPVTAKQVRRWTDRDPVLSRVRHQVLKGWQDSSDTDIQPFQQRKLELSVQDGCLLWGHRVIVPPQGRDRMMKELHEGHPGVSRMKSLARSFVWWPGMDRALEEFVRQCDQCQRNRHLPAAVPIQPWEWPQRPWSRIHADYAGPFQGHMFLILVDAHSKWVEVKAVKNATSATTIEHFRSIFAIHGLPELLVTDNGATFTSAESKEFYSANGIRHVTSAPYHPSTNGQAERTVQTVKEFLKKPSSEPLEARLSRFLFRYRITPHTTTGVSPAELLMGRRPRSRLDLVLPSLAKHVATQQDKQATARNQHTKPRTFETGSHVYVRDLPTGKDWLPGVVVDTCGPRSLEIRLEDSRVVRRHYDHIRPRAVPHGSAPTGVSARASDSPDWMDWPTTCTSPPGPVDRGTIEGPPAPPLRRSSRITTPPDRYVSGL